MKNFQPFKMLPSRYANSRRAHGRGISGRASFVWLHGVLIPLAIGVETEIEIRRSSPDGPWHTVRMTDREAYDEIMAHYRMQPGIKRMVQSHRRKRGLDV